MADPTDSVFNELVPETTPTDPDPSLPVEVVSEAERKPIFDSRKYDDAGNVLSGSAYYDTESWEKGTREAQDAFYRAQSFAKRAEAQRVAAEQKLQEIERQYRAAPQQPEPLAPIQRQQVTTKMPEQLREYLSEDMADALEEWVGGQIGGIKSEVSARDPEKLVAQRFADIERRQQEAKFEQELGSIIEANKSFYDPSGALSNSESIQIAIADPQHPDHVYARRLMDLFDISQKLGSLASAHQYLSMRDQHTDIQKQIESARKEEREKVLREMKDKGARFVPKGGLDGTRGMPSQEDLAKMTEADRRALIARQAETKINWDAV